ncbi:hypothetical protein [Xenorhabdus sp. TH1]|uniref:hypothetical protein n=1 Tax=Xenorhabdus sp. TH1 TaxID=3130166 RepID=UPI0030D363FC
MRLNWCVICYDWLVIRRWGSLYTHTHREITEQVDDFEAGFVRLTEIDHERQHRKPPYLRRQ